MAVAATASYSPSSFSRQSRVSDDIVFRWNIVGSGTSARLDFALECLTTTGWIGIGIGLPASSMPGADIGVAFINATSQKVRMLDYYATDFAQLLPDPCGDNVWNATGFARNATATVLLGSRMLLVKDQIFDRSIVSNALDPVTSFLFAFGYSQALAIHKVAQHRLINLFATNPDRLAPLKNYSKALVTMTNFHVGTAETQYVSSACFSFAQLGLPANAYAAGFSINSASSFMHHMLLEGYMGSSTCRGQNVDAFVATSDPEGATMIFPAGVALDLSPFGSFRLQMHYNNPAGVAGVIDNSGVWIYWTATAPANKAAILELGDPQVKLSPQPLPPGKSTFTFECSSACTSQLPVNITVIASLHHMHQTGTRLSTAFFAKNGTLRRNITTEYFDFHHQRGMGMVPLQLKQGDVFRTSCSYDTSAQSSPVVWGIGSQNEMCIDFLYYYPAQTNIHPYYCGLGACGTLTYSGQPQSFNRTFGVLTKAACPALTSAPATLAPALPAVPVCLQLSLTQSSKKCDAGQQVNVPCGSCTSGLDGKMLSFTNCSLTSNTVTLRRGCNADCTSCPQMTVLTAGKCMMPYPQLSSVSSTLDYIYMCGAPPPPAEPVGTPLPVYYSYYHNDALCSSTPYTNYSVASNTCFQNGDGSAQKVQCIGNVVVNSWFSSATCAPASMYSKLIGVPQKTCLASTYKLSCSPLPLATNSVVFFKTFSDGAKCNVTASLGMIAQKRCTNDKMIVQCIGGKPVVSTFSDTKCTLKTSSDVTFANRQCLSGTMFDCSKPFTS